MHLVRISLSNFGIFAKPSTTSKAASDRTISEDFSLFDSARTASEESRLSDQITPFNVPANTPNPSYSFSNVIQTVKKPFPCIDNLQIPYIRKIGIKTAIDNISGFFSCQNYKINAVQFWFLDVIIDCLWKLQDEHHFPDIYQRKILEWILFVFDIISDPRKNFSRKEFFHIFNDSLLIASEKVQSGTKLLPSPSELFTIEEEAEEEMSFQSKSEETSSLSKLSEKNSYIALGIDESFKIFQIPKKSPECKSIKSVSDEIEEICSSEESIVFYKADDTIPDRFKSSSSSSIETEESETIIEEKNLLWKLSSSVSTGNSKNDVGDNIKQWMNYLEINKEYNDEFQKNLMINNCALSVIKDFVYDYLYETFQFTIVKMALMNHFHSISKRINTAWNVPKVLKEELKRPKPKKEKKGKVKKEKKVKEKKPKKAKPEKKKKKSEKTKSKKEKPRKPTKEEKEEMARLKKEQLRLEEELRKADENRRLLFPLKEAAGDDFYKTVFNRWVKPKEKKKK